MRNRETQAAHGRPIQRRPVQRKTKTRANREMDEFHRRIDAAGPNADVQSILTNLQVELGYGNLNQVAARYRR